MTPDTIFDLLQSWWTMGGLLLFGIIGGWAWVEWDKYRARRADYKRQIDKIGRLGE